MPDFNIHATSGCLAGAAMAAAGVLSQDLGPIQAGAVFVLGATGGLLPDLDSDTGKPLALLFQWLSVLLPVLLLPHIRAVHHLDTAFMLCYFPLFYLIIHYGVCPVVKRLTRHRGMMHSIPFALICAEAACFLLLESGKVIAFYGGLSMFLGCMVHLILDEFQSMDVKFGFIVILKRSSGSALKFAGNSLFGTLITYLVLSAMTWLLTLRMFPGIHQTFSP